jgi:uncharacterized protein YqhQ
MMRGPAHFAVACRRASGKIEVRTEPVPAFFTRYRWARWPLLRGVFALADAVVLGMKSLLYSANLALEDQQNQAAPPAAGAAAQVLLGPLLPLLATGSGGTIAGIAVTGSAIGGMGVGIALFMLLPSVVAGWFTPLVGETIWRQAIEGVVRVALVLGYIAAVGRMKEIQRVFQYHGAEHQAINAFEASGRLDVDEAVQASRIHPRCGTNFVLTVILLKALVFAMLPFHEALLPRLGLRLLMLPAIAAVSYELIRLAGLYPRMLPLRWLVSPGLWTQRLTTRVPDRGMVEVAVASLRAVQEAEEAAPAPAPSPAAAVA